MEKELKETQTQSKVELLLWTDLPLSNFELQWETQFLDLALKDWLAFLCRQNDKAILWHDTLPFDLRNLCPMGSCNLSHPSVFRIVYNWCQKLKQPEGVSYRTVELYERFIQSYYCQKFCLITASFKKSETTTLKKDVFQEIYTQIKHQSLLHLISCLQIASKLEDGYKVVTVNDAIDLLHESKRPSDRSTIVNSEVLVLVTLKHEINFPPISDFLDTFMCHLIKALKKKRSSERANKWLLKVDETYRAAMKLISIIYFDQEAIISRIVTDLHSDESAQEAYREKGVRDFQRVQSDKVLLVTGSIIAALFHIQPNAIADVLRELHSRTGAYPSEVAVVSSILVNYLTPTAYEQQQQ